MLIEDIKHAAVSYDDNVLAKNEALKKAEEHSKAQLDAVREQIRKMPPPSYIHTLATAGSMARLEASDQSDLDLIMATSEKVDGAQATALSAWRADLCKTLQIEEPNPQGVFINSVHIEQLGSTAGWSEEAYGDVAKRILFLLESTWLYNEAEYEALLDQIIEPYAQDIVVDPKKNFVFLLNDVIRFFRALCVNYQFTKAETEGLKWPIRNIKLRHSRVLMYFSMVASIGLLSREHRHDKVEALKTLIRTPPLRRLALAYELSGDCSFFKVAQFYNQFLSLMARKEVRDELKALDYQVRYSSEVFAQLKANSDGLSAELLRFFEARRRQWDDRFFEYMIL